MSIPGQRGRCRPSRKASCRLKTPAPAAIGHRIVHGGPKLRQHCLIDGAVLRQLEAASAFAPLHTPPALVRHPLRPGAFSRASAGGMFRHHISRRNARASRACFRSPRNCERLVFSAMDFTAFPANRSCTSLRNDLPDRLIIAHLGNGASVTAVKDGKSVDTSMGLTPTGGVIMGTRTGDLDPGVLVYLMREKKFDAAMLEDLVDHRSGLLGNFRRRERHAAFCTKPPSSNADARLAIEMFCYSVRKQIAAMIAALGGRRPARFHRRHR